MRKLTLHSRFQSTPSAWRETITKNMPFRVTSDFNPLPPHGGRRLIVFYNFTAELISIHSLRMEGDSAVTVMPHCTAAFQSTPSAWRETSHTRHPLFALTFQSTPSAWRETFFEAWKNGNGTQFQSTPSAWRETRKEYCGKKPAGISIHSLRMEGDKSNSGSFVPAFLFQSTPSAWRETSCWIQMESIRIPFQSTPSAWRETKCTEFIFICQIISIHSLRMEGDNNNAY